jgi:hypothetical protein
VLSVGIEGGGRGGALKVTCPFGFSLSSELCMVRLSKPPSSLLWQMRRFQASFDDIATRSLDGSEGRKKHVSLCSAGSLDRKCLAGNGSCC